MRPASAPSAVRRTGAALLVAAGISNSAFLLQPALHLVLDPFNTFVSELAAWDQPYALDFEAADLLTALLVAVAVLLGWHRGGARGWLRVAGVALLVFAACTAADSLVPLDCAPTGAPRCAGYVTSLALDTHSLTGVLEATAVVLSTYAISLGTRASPSWRLVSSAGLVVGRLQLGLSLLISVLWLLDAPGLGLAQRLSVLLFSLTLIAVGITLWGHDWEQVAAPPWVYPQPQTYQVRWVPDPGPGEPGGELRIEVHNPQETRTVVFSNGLTLPAELWHPVVAELPGLRSVLFDRPGLGGSTGQAGAPLAGQVEQLRAVMLAEATSTPGEPAPGSVPAIVVGHSHGAIVAEALARLHPELVCGLVLVDPSVPRPRPRPADLQGSAADTPVAQAPWQHSPLFRVADRILSSPRVTHFAGPFMGWLQVSGGTARPGAHLPKGEFRTYVKSPRHLRAGLAELFQEPRDRSAAVALAWSHPLPDVPVRIVAGSRGGWPMYRPHRRWLGTLARRAQELRAPAPARIDGAHLLMLDAPSELAAEIADLSGNGP